MNQAESLKYVFYPRFLIPFGFISMEIYVVLSATAHCWLRLFLPAIEISRPFFFFFSHAAKKSFLPSLLTQEELLDICADI